MWLVSWFLFCLFHFKICKKSGLCISRLCKDVHFCFWFLIFDFWLVDYAAKLKEEQARAQYLELKRQNDLKEKQLGMTTNVCLLHGESAVNGTSQVKNQQEQEMQPLLPHCKQSCQQSSIVSNQAEHGNQHVMQHNMQLNLRKRLLVGMNSNWLATCTMLVIATVNMKNKCWNTNHVPFHFGVKNKLSNNVSSRQVIIDQRVCLIHIYFCQAIEFNVFLHPKYNFCGQICIDTATFFFKRSQHWQKCKHKAVII